MNLLVWLLLMMWDEPVPPDDEPPGVCDPRMGMICAPDPTP